MFKKAFLDFHVGRCGRCGLEMRSWAVERARLTCPNCGMEHEVECDEALDLSSGKGTEVVMLVPGEEGQPEDEGRVDVSQN